MYRPPVNTNSLMEMVKELKIFFRFRAKRQNLDFFEIHRELPGCQGKTRYQQPQHHLTLTLVELDKHRGVNYKLLLQRERLQNIPVKEYDHGKGYFRSYR